MKKLLPYLLSICILATWLYIKHVRLVNLEYYSDMFSFLQMPVSWMDGRPLLYENQYGYHDKIHNYYVVLLFGPLVYKFGAYGLFVGHLLLFAGALLLLFYTTRHLHQSKRIEVYVIIFALILGPISFWIWDNPTYGWHAELLYVPLSVVITTSLIYNKKVLLIVSTGITLLVKEDAPVLICCILLVFNIFKKIKHQPNQSLSLGLILDYKLIRLVGFWFLIFIAGMWFISFKNQFTESRLPVALGKLTNNIADREFLSYFIKIVISNFGLSIAAYLLIFALFRQVKSYRFRVIFLAILIGSLPVFFVNIIQGLYYYPATFMSVGWPPRFAATWGYLISTLLMTSCYLFSEYHFIEKIKYKLAAICAFVFILFAIQIISLYIVRRYNFTESYIFSMLPGYKSQYLLNDKSSLAAVNCLAENLPRNTNVLCPDSLFSYFHRNYIIWENAKSTAWKQPDIIIYNRQENNRMQSAINNYHIYNTKAFDIAISPALNDDLKWCFEGEKK